MYIPNKNNTELINKINRDMNIDSNLDININNLPISNLNNSNCNKTSLEKNLSIHLDFLNSEKIIIEKILNSYSCCNSIQNKTSNIDDNYSKSTNLIANTFDDVNYIKLKNEELERIKRKLDEDSNKIEIELKRQEIKNEELERELNIVLKEKIEISDEKDKLEEDISKYKVNFNEINFLFLF